VTVSRPSHRSQLEIAVVGDPKDHATTELPARLRA
jgi:hypothetical protein